MSAPDESWPMIEDAVFRLFRDLAAANAGEHIAIGRELAELGWSDIEAEYPVEATELLFRAQGRSLLNSDCLSRVMLVELQALIDGPIDGIVLPPVANGFLPSVGTNGVSGVLLGPIPTTGRLAIPVSDHDGTVSIAIADCGRVEGERLNTFDRSACWTRISAPLGGVVVPASTEWDRAIAAAHRGLGTELVVLADEALRIAVEHVSVRTQFGSPIGSFQSPRHLLADASARLESARALLAESWRFGGELSALAAKAAAGRAHRAVSDAALQVCGAIGLTLEHDLHRYVTRGFQLDSLCGSYQYLEAALSDRLFEEDTHDQALPTLVSWS